MGFASHICDVEVDPETDAHQPARYPAVGRGKPAVDVERRSGRCDSGHWLGAERRIHLGDDGRLQNPGLLDYRIPVFGHALHNAKIVKC